MFLSSSRAVRTCWMEMFCFFGRLLPMGNPLGTGEVDWVEEVLRGNVDHQQDQYGKSDQVDHILILLRNAPAEQDLRQYEQDAPSIQCGDGQQVGEAEGDRDGGED